MHTRLIITVTIIEYMYIYIYIWRSGGVLACEDVLMLDGLDPVGRRAYIGHPPPLLFPGGVGPQLHGREQDPAVQLLLEEEVHQLFSWRTAPLLAPLSQIPLHTRIATTVVTLSKGVEEGARTRREGNPGCRPLSLEERLE